MGSEPDITTRALRVRLTHAQMRNLKGVIDFVGDGQEYAGQFTTSGGADAFTSRMAAALVAKGVLDFMWMDWADHEGRAQRRGYFPTDLGREVHRIATSPTEETTDAG